MHFPTYVQGLIRGNEALCLSGGAEGSDCQWGMMAGRLGHGVIHWSFAQHRSDAPQVELIRLTQEQLNLADDALVRANERVQRRWPSNSEFTNNLLRRNWYQVAWTGALYAVGVMDHECKISGGTAWAVQMYMDRFLLDNEPMEKCQLYLFEQSENVWWQWRGEWQRMARLPPQPTGVWTGIGTRELSWHGKWAIRKLMGGYPLVEPQDVASYHSIVENPKIGDIIYIGDRKVPGRGIDDRAGGWGTVCRVITTADETWINVGEVSDNDEIPWSHIQHMQAEYRSLYGSTRCMTRSNTAIKANRAVPAYRGR